MNIFQIGALTALGAWFLLTLPWNLPGLQPRMGRLFVRLGLGRLIMLLPIWNFFAPRPGDADFCLLYRDQEDDGALTSWKMLDFPRTSGLARALWNPHSRPWKVIHDTMSHLSRLASPDKGIMRSQLVLSLPYIVLLRRVCREPAADRATLRQFAVLQYRLNHRDPTPSELKPVLVSYFHRLSGGTRGV